jgi:hypothetical protein
LAIIPAAARVAAAAAAAAAAPAAAGAAAGDAEDDEAPHGSGCCHVRTGGLCNVE